MPTPILKVPKTISPTVAQNPAIYRPTHGALTLPDITMSEIANQAVPSTWHYRLDTFFSASLATLVG
jgi:hypothetical protein